jgi:hypothetical protein
VVGPVCILGWECGRAAQADLLQGWSLRRCRSLHVVAGRCRSLRAMRCNAWRSGWMQSCNETTTRSSSPLKPMRRWRGSRAGVGSAADPGRCAGLRQSALPTSAATGTTTNTRQVTPASVTTSPVGVTSGTAGATQGTSSSGSTNTPASQADERKRLVQRDSASGAALARRCCALPKTERHFRSTPAAPRPVTENAKHRRANAAPLAGRGPAISFTLP